MRMLHWRGSATIAAVGLALLVGSAVFAVTHTTDKPTYAIDPIVLSVSSLDAHGDTVDTGFRALAVIKDAKGTVVFEPPAPLRRLVQLAWKLQSPFYDGAGDLDNEEAHANAWTAAREQAGLDAQRGLMIHGAVRPPLEVGDIVMPQPGEHNVRSGPILNLFSGTSVRVLRGGEPTSVALPADYDFSGMQLVQTGASPHAPIVDAVIGHQGSSGGVAMALAYLQALTPGDLTGGRVIAATGTLRPTGSGWAIMPIGSATEKARSAAATGVDLLIVAPENEDEARAGARGSDLKVAAFTNLKAAVTYLCETGGTSSACDLSPSAVRPHR